MFDKNKWIWSWNGTVPKYLLEILFSRPLKEYLNTLRHIKKYALIISNHGKEISAYFIKDKKSKEKCNQYFRNNVEEYIKEYQSIITKTNKILEKNKPNSNTNNSNQLTKKELKKLANILIKNIINYLISQPETTKVLEDTLIQNLKQRNIPEKERKEIINQLKPNNTIITKKEKEFEILVKKIKTKSQKHNDILNFLWKFRSFYMINLEGNILEELKLLKKTIKEHKNIPKKRNFKEPTIQFTKRESNIVKYIQEIGSLRLRGKNTWMNLVLLIINKVQEFSKINNIDYNKIIEIPFKELLEIVDKKEIKMVNKFRRNNTIIITKNKIRTKKNKILKNNKLKKKHIVSGNVGYQGIVSGNAFIVNLQDNLIKKIKEIKKIKNPILIAEQTIPAYMPLIMKSKGIITNEGGILSHAAIISRELKIPSLIGTKIATKVFNNNDKITINTLKNKAFKK